ncbi:hypothetical protein [Candidatus Methylacidiphilum infernorum]|nr:hypothetical protein [Candidatus Methylacidiphilum infernorum]
MKKRILHGVFFGLVLVGTWIFSGKFIDHAKSILNERLIMEKEYADSKRYVQQLSPRLESIRALKVVYESRKQKSTEILLIDVLSRFQRRRCDFRLLSIFQTPLGIGLKAEARSAAIVDFLEFFAEEMPDFGFQSIALTAPAVDRRTGALFCEMVFKRNGHEQVLPSSPTSSTPKEKDDEKIQLLSPRPSLQK